MTVCSKSAKGLLAAAMLASLLAGCGPSLSKEQRQQGRPLWPSTQGLGMNREKNEQIYGPGHRLGETSGGVRPLAETSEAAAIGTETWDGKQYVAASDLAIAAAYLSDWDPQQRKFRIGQHDAYYELTADQTSAVKGGETVMLDSAPVIRSNQLYLPVSVVATLFGEELRTEEQDGSLLLYPISGAVSDPVNGPDEPNTGSPLDFEDDPADPFKGAAGEGNGVKARSSGQAAAFQLRNIDMDQLIEQTKRYMGVKYLFGASPYPESGRFDCSSFTDYIFSKYGVALPRTARAQAALGTEVSRKQLRKGDLLFFYVPGRFRSDQVVGHVGIYIGNQQMIHASPTPKDGVQITSINKPYWKKTFIAAKRVAY